MKAISGLALQFAPYDLPPPTSCPPSHPLSSVRMSLPVLPILRILRFYVLSSEDKRACARSIAGVLRCVDRNWREACDDDLVWLQLCSSIWVRTTLEWTGCNPAELDNIKNQHFSKHFVGFGIGRQYLTSEEAKVAEKKMMTVKKQIRTAAAKLVSVADGAGGGHELRKWLPTRHGSEDKVLYATCIRSRLATRMSGADVACGVAALLRSQPVSVYGKNASSACGLNPRLVSNATLPSKKRTTHPAAVSIIPVEAGAFSRSTSSLA
mmetsp:Transcript_34338/g.53665  ORF Transcript_34338/g.53665 Transcript_34338/m.53665 type:complete len:266 (+) Transcript_34338:50-847(+)